MKNLTLKMLLIVLSGILLIGCGQTNYVINPICTPDISGDAKCLLVLLQDTRDGLDIYLDIQNVEDGTVKTVSINGIKIKDFAGGERLNMRFTNLIYKLAEIRDRRIYDYRYNARQFIFQVRVIIQIDLISGKSHNKRHWSKDYWLDDEGLGNSTLKLEF